MSLPFDIIALDIAWLIVLRDIARDTPALFLELLELLRNFDALSPDCWSFAGTVVLVDEFFEPFGQKLYLLIDFASTFFVTWHFPGDNPLSIGKMLFDSDAEFEADFIDKPPDHIFELIDVITLNSV